MRGLQLVVVIIIRIRQKLKSQRYDRCASGCFCEPCGRASRHILVPSGFQCMQNSYVTQGQQYVHVLILWPHLPLHPVRAGHTALPIGHDNHQWQARHQCANGSCLEYFLYDLGSTYPAYAYLVLESSGRLIRGHCHIH